MSSEYLREFLKKYEMAVKVYSGAWGKLIHEKKNNNGGKFATDVIDTCPASLTLMANLPPVSTTQAELVANLLPLSLIPAAMTLMLFSGAWGKVIYEKNLKQKTRDTVLIRENIYQ